MSRYETIEVLEKRRAAWVKERDSERSTLRDMAPGVIEAIDKRLAELRAKTGKASR